MNIRKGDTVRISICRHNSGWPPGWAEGEVLSAVNWGTEEKPNWYIEVEKTSCSPGWQLGYGYWKQVEDGGKVELVS